MGTITSYFAPTGNTKNSVQEGMTKELTIHGKITKSSVPEGVTKVILNINNELKIGYLPKSLKILVFCHNYVFDILPKVIPDYVEIVSLGTGFNMDITENVLPKKLKILEISD